jgi:hypothetical protein
MSIAIPCIQDTVENGPAKHTASNIREKYFI